MDALAQPAPRTDKGPRVTYALAVFTSAFLLFQVEPLLSKAILPWFGGSPTVWTTCMLFFQVLLLGGYAYAHLMTRRLSLRGQVVLHVVLMASAILLLPIVPHAGWKPSGTEDPTWRILVLLTVTVGLPYFVLSATSPLLQVWFRLTRAGRSPYRLYALSNVGSLLALISYPFVVEPLLPGRAQQIVWSVGFVGFALVCGCAGRRVWHTPDRGNAHPQDDAMPKAEPPRWGVGLLWLALPACGSAMLLALTNHMCQDIAAVPFLWVLPLSIYLLSFIICFDHDRWYRRGVFCPLFVLSAALLCVLLTIGRNMSIVTQVTGLSAGLFVCTMVCHGELARLKPDPQYLTSFFLCCAAGGALGGVFVALVAPVVFDAYLELHLSLWLCAALLLIAFLVDIKPHLRWRRRWRAAIVPTVSIAGVLALGVVLWMTTHTGAAHTIGRSRNFYGVLAVTEGHADAPDRHAYDLRCGQIIHGSQFASPERRRQATTYYGLPSGMGLLLRHHPRTLPIRIGVVGLGVGTLAAYGKPGDTYRFYEINPDVVRAARTWFTYLTDSRANCHVVLGDGRLSLEREPPNQFDVLILDAFSGDAIPVHLLTREALGVYRRHLKPQGVLAVNVTNRHLDLVPVVAGLAAHWGRDLAVIRSGEDERRGLHPAGWVLITGNRRLLQTAAIRSASVQTRATWVCLWTDDHSNLLHVLK